jgi:parallel beta-helix repeat protein
MHTSPRALLAVAGLLSFAASGVAQTSDTIFTDGFESGGVSSWSSGRGTSVQAAGALAGTTMGLRFGAFGHPVGYVQDDSPSREARYRARFYFQIESLGELNPSSPPRLFDAYQGDPRVLQIRIALGYDDGLDLTASIRLNNGKTVKTRPVALPPGAHFVEFDWRAATNAKVRNGAFRMWLDNSEAAKLTGLSNSAGRVDFVRLGLLGAAPRRRVGGNPFAPPAATAVSLDQFASRRTSFIGPDFSAGGLPIGEWSDAPGSCPAGMSMRVLTTPDQLRAASRGDDLGSDPNTQYSLDPPQTCYFIKNGTYVQAATSTYGDRDLLLYILRGGTAATPRTFVGESREGVVLRGRAATGDSDNPAAHVTNIVLSNMTFDLTGGLPGYLSDDSYNTLTLNGNSSKVLVDHVTFTGDCAHGLNGAHIETERGFDGLVVDSSLVENFGHCSGSGDIGHQDHGIYLAAGRNITIRNNVIRGNSSRGIQLYTGSDPGDSLTNVTIEENRIYQNGHADYEDGIVINGPSGFPIDNVVIFRNLIYRNFYSGIRWAGPATSGILVQNNTFDHNGAGSASGARSEINIDDYGEAVNTDVQLNLFSIGNKLINDCLDAATHSFSVSLNAGEVFSPSASTNCVTQFTSANPQFVNAGAGDYHTQNVSVGSYGAYAP